MLRTISIATLLTAAGSLAFAATRLAPWSQEMPQPTDEHAFVQKGLGEWEGTMTTFTPGAPTDPIAVSQSVVAVGPFWTQATLDCDFMGMPYVGTGALGYDPDKGKFVGTWIDSMGSYLAMMEGEKTADGTLIMRWQAPDMMGNVVPHRYELVRKGGSEISTFYSGEGEGMKSMVITLRKKGEVREAGADK